MLKRYEKKLVSKLSRNKQLRPFQELSSIILFVDSHEADQAAQLCKSLEEAGKKATVFLFGKSKTIRSLPHFNYVCLPSLFSLSKRMDEYMRQLNSTPSDALFDFSTQFRTVANLMLAASISPLKVSIDKGDNVHVDIRFGVLPTSTLQEKFDTALQCMNMMSVSERG